ncbi:PREDICTED: ubiquitin-like protein 7 [Papilio polytes]|uniref:ubiquitin-like protein 7 n=1 Tax=Papilio polytes TaxID=76194 RepID=UPI000676587D|nr:PREDICTED: ubiquitin-like protein 7 [Papilio polytes]
MDSMENQSCVFLGVKVKPGPIERYKLDNFTLENKIINLKAEAEKRVKEPSSSLEAIYHGKILRDESTLQDCGIKYGEMVHIVKKKITVKSTPAYTFSDVEIQQLNTSLRTLGCTPNAPGWTRAMQLLNDDATLAEVVDQLPSLSEDCVGLSILHEVELLAALGANVETMRRGAEAHPELPAALRHLTRLVRSRNTASDEDVPTSGFAYSLEALSEDEDVDEEDADEPRMERSTSITREQLTAALQAATDSALPNNSIHVRQNRENLLRLLEATPDRRNTARSSATAEPSAPSSSTAAPPIITTEMFNEAMTEAMSRAGEQSSSTPETTFATSSQNQEEYATQISHMHEMGLTDDALNMRALVICSGDVNAAINLVFSGAIGDD